MKMTSPLGNLAIVAESPLTRLGIEQFILALQPEMLCPLQVSSVAELLKEIHAHSIGLLISELAGADESTQQGAHGLMQLTHMWPGIHQIIYTYNHSGELLHALYQLPQVSLIARQETQEQTCNYFLQALAGSKVCSPLAQLAIVEHTKGTQRIRQQLTSCEQHVLEYLFRGLSLTETATRLHRSIKTVSAHKRNAMQKLGVDNDVGLFSLKNAFLARQNIAPNTVIY